MQKGASCVLSQSRMYEQTLCWLATVDSDAAHVATVAMIVVESKMLHTAIVPESDGSFCPTEAAGDLFSSGLGE